MTTAQQPAVFHEVVILGAGMSGLCMAVTLRRAGITDFVILEKSDGLGGTWWDNRYPGAHVDVPAPLYSLSFAPNPHWQCRFAAASEIQAYQQRVAHGHGVVPHLRLGHRVDSARFDADTGHWHLQATRADGTPLSLACRFFVCSTGPLSVPRWPAIDGLDSFGGERLHSAAWDAAAPLAGRRVAIVGTGSTAAQLTAPIVAQAAAVHVFQRTANWVLPRLDRAYGPLDRALARLPPYSRAVRAAWYGVLEWGRRGFDEGTLARRGMLRTAERHRRRQVHDPLLRERLRPPYPLGCKRIIYSNDYYPALQQPHVRLVTDTITRVEPDGVRTADGTLHAADVLVCATGFDVEHSLASLPVAGLGGQTLAQAWAEGPHAQLGLTVPGFPNLFLMLGPNTATGHTSTLLYIEPGAHWVLSALQQVRQRGARWVVVREAAEATFNRHLQARLQGLVWSDCRSWYRAHSGLNFALWPGYTGEYRRAVAAQAWADFEFG